MSMTRRAMFPVGLLALVALAVSSFGGLSASAQDNPNAAAAAMGGEADTTGTVGKIKYPNKTGVIAEVEVVVAGAPNVGGLKVPNGALGERWLKAIEDTKNVGGTVTITYDVATKFVREVTRN